MLASISYRLGGLRERGQGPLEPAPKRAAGTGPLAR